MWTPAQGRFQSSKNMKEFKIALKNTFPIFFTYLFIGIAFGILMNNAGYGILLSVVSAVFVFAGSMQLIMVPMMVSGASLLSIAVMTIFVNARHLFYGIGFIERFRKMGIRYPYMILTLTDETYSVLCSVKYEDDVDTQKADFFIAMLDHFYWIFGCFIGALAGSFLKFDLTGIDFSATAFFLVVVVNQFREYKTKLPFIISVLCSAVFLVFLGPQKFLIPAMTTTLIMILFFKKPISKHGVIL